METTARKAHKIIWKLRQQAAAKQGLQSLNYDVIARRLTDDEFLTRYIG